MEKEWVRREEGGGKTEHRKEKGVDCPVDVFKGIGIMLAILYMLKKYRLLLLLLLLIISGIAILPRMFLLNLLLTSNIKIALE